MAAKDPKRRKEVARLAGKATDQKQGWITRRKLYGDFKNPEQRSKNISRALKNNKNALGHGRLAGAIAQNHRIKQNVFEEQGGKCQKCKKKLIRNKRGTWVAHHTDMTLEKDSLEYYESTELELLCQSCHVKLHKAPL